MKIFRFFLFLFSASIVAQVNSTKIVIDENYREDQLYLGVSYNVFAEKPEGLIQTGLSGGVHMGFLRDFPLNKRRNFGLAIGLGWSYNSYNQNFFIGEENEKTIFQILDRNEVSYETNRFSTYLFELPIEIRWRTSTPTLYKFWRIYAGFKIGYSYFFKSEFRQENNTVVQTNVGELNRFRFGSTLSLGRGNFNLQVYYGLNSFFNFDNENFSDLTALQVGLIFYIL